MMEVYVKKYSFVVVESSCSEELKAVLNKEGYTSKKRSQVI